MISFPQGIHRTTDEGSLWRSIVFALPRTYAVVFYSTDTRFGWFLLFMSLLLPQVALAGLGGIMLAAAGAWFFGLDRGLIRSGFLLFNPLLSCSAIQLVACSFGWPLPFTLAVLSTAALSSMILTYAIQGWVGSRIGISPQSLPSVLVVAALCQSGFSAAYGGTVTSEWSHVDIMMMPGFLRAFFHAFAAMAFQASDLTGILIYIAFVLSSPLGGLMATIGYVAGALTMHALGMPVGVQGTAWCGFNFLLAGIALGAGYHVPNRKSLLLAAGGGSLTAIVSLGLAGLMGHLALDPGALPYNLIVIGTVAAIRLATRENGLIISPLTTLQPEGVARLIQINRLRFPDYNTTALFLPCAGELVVTQGFDGTLTHRGAWSHALDLETPGRMGSWNAGDRDLSAYGIYGTAVYAPVTGTVVAMENKIPDNLIGHNNPESNWGNHVIIRTDFGVHVMLAHFMMDSITVVAGQRVTSGTCLGSCGNSGRSPVPHLHLHVQAGPFPGSPTIPFVMKHFVQRLPGDPRLTYHLSGVPAETSVLRPAVPSPVLHGCFTGWLPGLYRYDIGGAEEYIRLDFDERGRFRMESAQHQEQLTLYLTEGVLYADPFEGRASTVLSLLAIVLARVPCIDDPDVIWRDMVPAAPHLTQRRRWLHDLWDPFLQVAVLPYQYAMTSTTDGAKITATLETSRWSDPSIPTRLVGNISGRNGLVIMEGETSGGRKIGFHLTGYTTGGDDGQNR